MPAAAVNGGSLIEATPTFDVIASGGDGGDGMGPTIALVSNKFKEGRAIEFIVAEWDGIYTNVSLNNFNRLRKY